MEDEIDEIALEVSIQILINLANQRLEMTARHLRADPAHYSIQLIGDDLSCVFVGSLDERAKWKERGFGSFSIKERMLQSAKAKISKDGYRYRSIPIKTELGRPPTTAAGFNEHEALTNALRQSNMAYFVNGLGQENLKAIGQGITFTKTDESTITSTAMKTMSEKPGTSAWIHPGSEGANIERDMNVWLEQRASAILEEAYERIVKEMSR